ncbi:MAG: Na+/H+ antiporter NhaC family protein, partial [Pseudomonadota bacterium]
VVLALLIAVLSAECLIILQSDPRSLLLTPIYTVDRVVSTVTSEGNARVLLFSLLVGALIAFIRDSGGVSAFVDRLIHSGFVKSKRRAGGVTMLTGIAVFIESNLSVLASGIMARGLFDRFNMSRARLAYVIDSTCAPVCILILLNGWGAYIISLLSVYDLPVSPIVLLWSTVPFNFYALITLLLVAYTIAADRVHGPMIEAEKQLEKVDTEIDIQRASRSRFMLVPMLIMVLGALFFMWWTGDGDFTQGSGSKSVLYATFLSCVVGYCMMTMSGNYSHQSTIKVGFKGMNELLPLVTIVLLSITLGASLKVLGTGIFVAGVVGEHLASFLVLPVLFITGAVISFTTGTSWGTFAILIPIGIPLAQTVGLPLEMVLAAILGGGIFGDHCSPISDTTAVSSLAAGCDLLTHVKTQLPYAIFGGVLTVIVYATAGAFVG